MELAAPTGSESEQPGGSVPAEVPRNLLEALDVPDAELVLGLVGAVVGELDPHRASELRMRPRWAWMRPTRRYDDFKDLLAAAEEQLSEQRAAELLGERPAERLR